MKSYLRLTLRSAAVPETTGRLVAELAELGTLGVREREDGLLEAFFPADAVAACRDGERWRRRGARLVEAAFVPEADWLAPYRAASRPFPLGRGFAVDPREPGARPAPAGYAGRRLLKLPARRAFGVGSHETTRLVVELLEARPPRGARVLDVGCGTGVLALVAVELGAASVVGLDVDPVAAFHARENQQLNGHSYALLAATVAALALRSRFDLVLANVLPARLEPHFERVAARVTAGGELILSGLLTAEEAPRRAALERLGLSVLEIRGRGEWLALRAARP